MARPLGPSHDLEKNLHKCNRCETWLTYDLFYTRKASTCRSCLQIERNKKTEDRIRTQLLTGSTVTNNGRLKAVEINDITEKPCGICGEYKHISHFDKTDSTGLPRKECKTCMRDNKYFKPENHYVRKGSDHPCECGCGELTKINEKTNQPSKFCPGHYSKTLTRKQSSSIKVNEKKCSRCAVTKPSSEFNSHTRSIDGLYIWCRQCKHEYDAIKMNTESYRKRKRESARHRRAKSRGATGQYTDEQLEARYAYYGYKCYICGTTEKLTVDHVIPLDKGGTNWPANLRPCCLSCNSGKKNRHHKNYV